MNYIRCECLERGCECGVFELEESNIVVATSNLDLLCCCGHSKKKHQNRLFTNNTVTGRLEEVVLHRSVVRNDSEFNNTSATNLSANPTPNNAMAHQGGVEESTSTSSNSAIAVAVQAAVTAALLVNQNGGVASKKRKTQASPQGLGRATLPDLSTALPTPLSGNSSSSSVVAIPAAPTSTPPPSLSFEDSLTTEATTSDELRARFRRVFAGPSGGGGGGGSGGGSSGSGGGGRRTVKFKKVFLLAHDQEAVPMASTAAYNALLQQNCVKGDVTINGQGLQYMEQFRLLVPHIGALHAANAHRPERLLYKFVQKVGHTAQLCDSSENFSNLNPPPNIAALIRACNHGTSTTYNLFVKLVLPLEALMGEPGEGELLGDASAAGLALGADTVAGGTVAGGTVAGGTVAGGTVAGGTVAGGNDNGNSEDDLLSSVAEAVLLATSLPIITDLTVEESAVPVNSAPNTPTIHTTLTTHTSPATPTTPDYQNLYYSDDQPPQADFSVSSYLSAHYPRSDTQAKSFAINADEPFLSQMQAFVNQMSFAEIHMKPTFRLRWAGRTDVAVDVGGVMRHVFANTFREAFEYKVNNRKPAFCVNDDGFKIPAPLQLSLQDRSFWTSFGTLLYWALMNECWAGGLHISVGKFLVGEKPNAADLVGVCAAQYDALLHAEDDEDNPALQLGPVSTELFDRGIDPRDYELSEEPTERLQQKKDLLAQAVLHTALNQALQYIYQGFAMRARTALFKGSATLSPLTSTYLSTFSACARVPDDIFNYTSEEVSRTHPVYRAWEEAVRRLKAPEEVELLMAWICGHAILPPKEMIVLTFLPDDPGRDSGWACPRPAAHTCFSRVDLYSPKYMAPLCASAEEAVSIMLADLRYVIHNGHNVDML